MADKTRELVVDSELPPDSAPLLDGLRLPNSRVVLTTPIPAEARQRQLSEILRVHKPDGVLSFVCD